MEKLTLIQLYTNYLNDVTELSNQVKALEPIAMSGDMAALSEMVKLASQGCELDKKFIAECGLKVGQKLMWGGMVCRITRIFDYMVNDAIQCEAYFPTTGDVDRIGVILTTWLTDESKVSELVTISDPA